MQSLKSSVTPLRLLQTRVAQPVYSACNAVNRHYNWSSHRADGSPTNLLSRNCVTSHLPEQRARWRSLCSDLPREKPRTLPTVMEFPEIVWPSILKTIKNWILINFIVRPYFDQDFQLPTFIAGTKQAVQLISTKMSQGEMANLHGLVSNDALSEMKTSVSRMSVAQRNELQISKSDIYFSFPYQVGIMFDDSNGAVQKRWIEITMVFHVLRGLKEMQDRGQPPPINLGMLPEYREKISICNYRFIKEFTQGIDSDWTCNIVNHFKPSDLLNE